VSAALCTVLVVIALLYWGTYESLISTWRRSDTFTHCFLIPPICLFLIWSARDRLAAEPTRVSFAGLAAVLLASFGWFLAGLADVQVGQQLAAVFLLPATVVALFGASVGRQIAFPLAYLVFAVPFGEFLIPTLVDFTASFTVGALRLTGVPVVREGAYFSIPSGDFEVAKACSGIRYLIASAAIGVLHAHLSFRAPWKQVLLVAVYLVAAVIANGVRAYGIVMIAHLSDMQLAVGTDHLIYGWIFFAALMALMFTGAHFFADTPLGSAVVATRSRGGGALPLRSRSKILTGSALLLVLAFAAVGPLLLEWRTRDVASGGVAPVSLPTSIAQWKGPRAREVAEAPIANSGSAEAVALYESTEGTVQLEIVTRPLGVSNPDIIGMAASRLRPDGWQVLETGRARVDAGSAPQEVVLRSHGEDRVVWFWYVVGDSDAAADWHAKALETWQLLRGARARESLVLLSAQAGDPATARSTLRRFHRVASSAIDDCIVSRRGACATELSASP